MDNTRDIEFTSLHMSALSELGNIGAGNAVTAMAQMLDIKVDMSVPKVSFLSFNEVQDALGGAEKLMAAVLVNISSEHINGVMMFLVELREANTMVGALLNQEVKVLREMELSALKEIGNILTGSYLRSLAEMLSTKIDMSVPYLSIDMAGAILSVPVAEFAMVSDDVLFIESVFDSDQKDISGYFILAPDQESFRYIFRTLGLEA